MRTFAGSASADTRKIAAALGAKAAEIMMLRPAAAVRPRIMTDG
jgi:hypothetical protein